MMKLLDLIEILADDKNLQFDRRHPWLLSITKRFSSYSIEFATDLNGEVSVWHYNQQHFVLEDCSEKSLTDPDLIDWIKDWIDRLEN